MRTILVGLALLVSTVIAWSEPVSMQTFVRAETDNALRVGLERAGGFGRFAHERELAPIEHQPVIRQNRDTIYSSAVVDLSDPVTITIPRMGQRYMTLHVINQDHYMFVISEPGQHKLSQKTVGTRFATLLVRTFVDPANPDDMKLAHQLQDGLRIEGGGKGPFDAPDWDQEQLISARQALNTLAQLGFNSALAFGTREETDPFHHLLGSASGWGGLPGRNAVYFFNTVEKNDGAPYAIHVKDVPVDAFWSITVYNAQGYIDKNDLGIYSYNNVTAKPNDDGSVTINFGKCGDKRMNCLPVSKGWTYTVRLYEPRDEILDGSWTFPEAHPVN